MGKDSLGELKAKSDSYYRKAIWRMIGFLCFFISVSLYISIKMIQLSFGWTLILIVVVSILSIVLISKFDRKYIELNKKKREFNDLFYATVTDNVAFADSLREDLYRKKIHDDNVEDAELFCTVVWDLYQYKEHFRLEQAKDCFALYKYSKSLHKRINEYRHGDKIDRRDSREREIKSASITAINSTKSPSGNSSEHTSKKNIGTDMRTVPHDPSPKKDIESADQFIQTLTVVSHEPSIERDMRSENSFPQNPDEVAVPNKNSSKPIKIDFVKMLDENIELGLRGELAVMEYERKKLLESGKSDLASRIRHVSQDDGDGLGYDILSFLENGVEKFIEVKTTIAKINNQFYLSNNELSFIRDHENSYYLYRLSMPNGSNGELDITLGKDIFTKFELQPNKYVVKFR